MNMKNIKYILFTAAAGLCLTLASCSEDKYEPGPEPANDCMEAYFLSSNSSEYILGSESTSVTLDVLTDVKKRRIVLMSRKRLTVIGRSEGSRQTTPPASL